MYYQEDLMAEPVRYRATGKLMSFCNSLICTKSNNKNGTYSALGRELNVSQHTIDCPNCGSALLWLRESEIYKRRLVAEKNFES